MKKISYLIICSLVLILILSFTSCEGGTEGNEQHSHHYYGVQTQPTCLVGGYDVFTCECGDTYTEFWSEPLDYCNYETVIEHQPTLTDPGYYEMICSWCGESKFEEFMDPLTPSKGLVYELNEEGNAYIIVGVTEEYQHGDVVVIPDFYEGLPVVEIAGGFSLDYALRFFIFDNLTKIDPSTISAGTRSYFVSENNPAFCSVDGVLYSKDMKTLVKFAEGGTGMGEDVFMEYIIPDSVEVIGDYAFVGTGFVTNVVFGKNVKSIGKDAFMECRSIISCQLNDSLTSIGERAFYYNYNLNSINLTESIETIGKEAFCGCEAIGSISIPASVTSIGEYAFMNCTSLEKIDVSKDNTAYMSHSNAVCSKDGKNLLFYAIGSHAIQYNVPDGVEKIESYAFSYAQYLKQVSLPQSLITIGNNAFEYCASIESLIIPDSVEVIESYAFMWCMSMQSVHIGKSVTAIENHAFYECRDLAQVYIPRSIIYIEEFAFAESKAPMTVTYEGTDFEWGSLDLDNYIFYNTNVEKMIYLGDEE